MNCPHCYQPVDNFLARIFKEGIQRCPTCYRYCVPKKEDGNNKVFIRRKKEKTSCQK